MIFLSQKTGLKDWLLFAKKLTIKEGFMRKALEIIADVLETDVSEVNLESKIVNWDSLAFIQIVSNIDDEFGLNLSIETIIEDAAVAETVGDLLGVLGVNA
jgi:acyl carrier protein